MTVDGWELLKRGARRIGGRTGTLGTVTPNAGASGNTTAILNGLINTTGDDTYYAADRLIFPDSAAGSQETLIKSWDDSLGQATFLDLTAGPTEDDDYVLVSREDYTLNEFEEALRKCLLTARRTYRYVIPTTPDLELYPLNRLDWLEGAGSVDAVFWSDSPLMLHNEDFALWQDGASAAPDGWTLVGSGASVARVSTGIRSAYAAQVTAGGGEAAYLEQAIPGSLVQWLTRRTFPVYTPMRGSAWVQTSASNAARVGIFDGSTTHYSAYVDNDGVPHYPTLSVTPDADMTAFRLRLEVAASQTATWHFGGLMQNTQDAENAFAIKDRGSQAYTEIPITHAKRNIGGVPTVELRRLPGDYGQLIVYSRRPFPALTSLADVFEDQYARALEAGMLVFLTDNIKPNQDRTRLDYILNGGPGQTGERQRWVSFLQQNVDLPVHTPMNLQIVGSA